MVKSFYVLLTALLLVGTTSLLARDVDVKEFEVNGIQVILAPADNELVSVIFGLEGGIMSGETDNPELGSVVADLIAASGSESVTKDELRRFLARTSTRIGGSADVRGVRLEMTSTRARFDESWDLLSSMIRNPSYDETELRNLLQRRENAVKGRHSNPESHSYITADSLLTVDHPVLSASTDLEDLAEINLEMLAEFFAGLQERSRAILVVVGDVDRADLEKKLNDFAHWPNGSYNRRPLRPLDPPARSQVEVIPRASSPTTYLAATFAGPMATEEAYWPLAVGMSHLRNVLFEELRTKRNLTYAPGAFFGANTGQGIGYLSVSTVLPDSSWKIMKRELERMAAGKFDEADLEKSKQVFTTRYYMREMTNARKAASLFWNERNGGDWQRAFSYEAIQGVDKESVVRALMQYARSLQVGLVGNLDGIDAAAYRYEGPAAIAEPGR